MKPRGTVVLQVPVPPRFREELRERSKKSGVRMGRVIEAAVREAWRQEARCSLPLCPLEETRR